jgi:hypothetical protein
VLGGVRHWGWSRGCEADLFWQRGEGAFEGVLGAKSGGSFGGQEREAHGQQQEFEGFERFEGAKRRGAWAACTSPAEFFGCHCMLLGQV